jgi:dTDP-N-acetylfucosamine:lipid II N-acetylfucosaminyltransferase
MKILHIISEDKFLDSHLSRWDHCGEEHTFVYLRTDLTYKGKNQHLLRKIQPFSAEYFSLISEAEQYDMIFIYLLNFHKAYLLNRIGKRPVIVWHFYGTEIYRRSPFRQRCISEQTKALLKKSSWHKLSYMAVYVNLLKRMLLNRSRTPSAEIDLAMRKTDYFWWYNVFEYELFKKELPGLPPFLQLPVISRMADADNSSIKDEQILVGNSQAAANNHIDTLLMLREARYSGKVLMPFNYGSEKAYERNLRKVIKGLDLNITLLEGFMKYDEYVNTISSCQAAVFNSYRQMALGNIFIGLFNGVKIYLNDLNSTYHWLRNTGFHVFSVNRDLGADLLQGNLSLSQAQAMHNKNVFRELVDPAHTKTFLLNLGVLARQDNKISRHYEDLEDIKQQ